MSKKLFRIDHFIRNHVRTLKTRFKKMPPQAEGVKPASLFFTIFCLLQFCGQSEAGFTISMVKPASLRHYIVNQGLNLAVYQGTRENKCDNDSFAACMFFV